jgi:hypothetical protein
METKDARATGVTGQEIERENQTNITMKYYVAMMIELICIGIVLLSILSCEIDDKE